MRCVRGLAIVAPGIGVVVPPLAICVLRYSPASRTLSLSGQGGGIITAGRTGSGRVKSNDSKGRDGSALLKMTRSVRRKLSTVASASSTNCSRPSTRKRRVEASHRANKTDSVVITMTPGIGCAPEPSILAESGYQLPSPTTTIAPASKGTACVTNGENSCDDDVGRGTPAQPL